MVQKKYSHQMDSQVADESNEILVDPDNSNCNNTDGNVIKEVDSCNELGGNKISVNGNSLSNGDSEPMEESEERDERYEMIIRESIPEELSPDVVRCNSRVNDGLDDLQINLGSLRQRFESISDSSPSSPSPTKNPDKAIQRSESILIRLKRYQSAISGSRKMSGGNEEDEVNSADELSENEESTSQDPNVIRESKGREKVVPFAGLSSLKSQWESGNVNTTEGNDGEEAEVVDGDLKEELYKLRQRICLGRSASMRQMYEKGGPTLSIAQSNGFTHRQETALVAGSVKACSIKDKFEKGEIDKAENRLELLKKEKMQDLKVVAVADTAAREAKQIFKKMDASIKYNKRDSLPPTSSSPRRSFMDNGGGLVRSFTTSAIRPNKEPDLTDVVRHCDPVEKDDVMIDTTQLQERYKFFEQYKEPPKEPRRFEMTPPRDTAQSSVKESEPVENGNADIVKCSYVTDDIPKTDTAKKMLGRFKQLESQASQDIVSNGPKALKRITPPREFQPVLNNNNNLDEGQKVATELSNGDGERDLNIVRSEDKIEEVIPIEPEIARNLKAKFENWAVEVSKMNDKNREKDVVDDGDPLPQPHITKNLKAKFEAIKNESSPVEKPKPRVSRFVRTPSSSP